MSATNTVLLVLAVVGFASSAWWYRELFRWARQCQRAEIAIAYNNRVRFRASLVEWLEWANALDGQEAARGRVVYQAHKMRVAILRPRPPGRIARAILRGRRRRRERAPVTRQPGGARNVKAGQHQ